MNNFFVDVKCIEIAEHFLKGWKHGADDVRELAEQFQEVAETFCEFLHEELEDE